MDDLFDTISKKSSSAELLASSSTTLASQGVAGSFSNGVLNVTGNGGANVITIGRDEAGKLLLNAGSVPITGGTPTVSNTSVIQVSGMNGNDTITLDETNGPLPRAVLLGGAGNDVLTGGSGADQLFGQADADQLFGKGGADLLFGGAGNDTLSGGAGNDQIFGEAGNDRMVWGAGDDSDLMEGGDGVDTAQVDGSNGADVYSVTANGTRVRVDRLGSAPAALDIGTTEQLSIAMGGGDDQFSAVGNLAPLIAITVDGGAGNDSILGGNGADLLMGGDGNDFIDGQQGSDIAQLGAGDDVFQWDPGDGNDTVEGGTGIDTLHFNGSGASEVVNIVANADRVRLTRDIAAITMDLNDIETIRFNAFGGADTVNVGDLSGTDAGAVQIDLGFFGGGGDAQVDSVNVSGRSASADSIQIAGSGSSVSVLGLPASVSILNAEAQDLLAVHMLGGDDNVAASVSTPVPLRLTIEGGAGNDTLHFGGSAANENIDIAANSGRTLVTAGAGSQLDVNDVEVVRVRALGGTDTVTLGDLAGTDVQQVHVDLGGTTGDGQLDRVVVGNSLVADAITVSGSAGTVMVTGLSAAVTVTHADAQDVLAVNGHLGDDTIDASALTAGTVALQMNGGLGNDMLIGSAGDDLVTGGDGNDTALLGAGDDRFVWNPGDDNDVIDGQAGFDTLQFNGAGAAEHIGISAMGDHVRFTRDIAAITMDTDGVEQIQFIAGGGTDDITVNDVTGTDLQRVHLDLAVFGGTTGDGQADRVVIHGTSGDDAISVAMVNGDVVVTGLQAEIVISHFEAGLDALWIYGGDGADVIDAAALDFRIAAFGGEGDDSLIGGSTIDDLFGDGGDDVLLGNGGDDYLDGGAGSDVLIGGDGDDVLVNGEILIPGF